MRACFLAVLVFVSMATTQVSTQTANDEALQSILRAETKAFFDRDYEAWQSSWLHDPQVTRTLIGYGDDATEVGWDSISATVAKGIRGNPTPMVADVSMERFTVRQDGNLAWVEYNQVTTVPPGEKSTSRERRVLVRDGGQWKIASQITIGSESGTEAQLNGLGYRLLNEKKTQEAIELLRINVRLYPESWNVYDSLGEAYAVAGQKDRAVQNYKKSVQLNPKNESAKAAMAKLKAK